MALSVLRRAVSYHLDLFSFYYRFTKMYINMVPFSATSSMKNALDNDRPVNLSRNLQELDAASASALCGLLDAAVKQEEESLRYWLCDFVLASCAHTLLLTSISHQGNRAAATTFLS